MVDAFNRYANSESSEDIIHLMKYIFPRQFSLHNAFTSIVDSRETTHKFKDYTLREQEIEASQLSSKARSLHDGERTTTHLPRRLRGNPLRLVAKMQKLHSRCAYVELLRHYCPAEVTCSIPITMLSTHTGTAFRWTKRQETRPENCESVDSSRPHRREDLVTVDKSGGQV